MHHLWVGGVTRVLRRLGVAFGLPAGVLVAVLAPSSEGAAQSLRDMSILTGSKTGTYHRFGTDIGDLIRARCEKTIRVRDSAGSLDNLQRLRSEQSTQMAIVQQDVLDYVRQSELGDARIKEWIEKFKYVHPLYLEEVHVITRRDAGIRTLADLAGKRIATDMPGSGTSLTATFVLAGLSGVREVQIGAREGILRLLGLAGGERVDAVFYVAGKPVPLLSGEDSLITERHLRQLAFVAIPGAQVPSFYSPAELSPATYAWLDRRVETVAVRAVLIAYDFQKEQCANVAMVARLIQDNVDDLERVGHKKWRDVDLAAKVPGWERYGCVARGLKVRRDGCRFVEAVGPGDLQPPPAPANCDDQCRPSGNPIVCMLCKNKRDLQQKGALSPQMKAAP